MKFEVINEELKIAACGIADLTMEQVHSFLRQWEDDASIGTLTLFYDKESGYVVLNQDNKDYKMYLDIAEAYLRASVERREAVEQKVPEGMHQTILVLKNSLTWRKTDRDIYQANKNCINNSDRITIDEIINRSGDRGWSGMYRFPLWNDVWQARRESQKKENSVTNHYPALLRKVRQHPIQAAGDRIRE